jgi:hypothetical protein
VGPQIRDVDPLRQHLGELLSMLGETSVPDSVVTLGAVLAYAISDPALKSAIAVTPRSFSKRMWIMFIMHEPHVVKDACVGPLRSWKETHRATRSIFRMNQPSKISLRSLARSITSYSRLAIICRELSIPDSLGFEATRVFECLEVIDDSRLEQSVATKPEQAAAF